MDKGKTAAAESSRIAGRRITGSDRRKRQLEIQSTQSQQPDRARRAYTPESSRPMEDDYAALPSPQPTASTASTHGTFMGSPSDDLMSHFVDSEGDAGSDGDDAGEPGGPQISGLIPSYRYHTARQLWSGEV